MLRIDNLKLPVGAKEDKLRAACAHALRVSVTEISISTDMPLAGFLTDFSCIVCINMGG